MHRVRAVLDEVFGDENCIADIVVEKTSGAGMRHIDRVADYVLWYGKAAEKTKFRPAYQVKSLEHFAYEYKFKQDSAGYRDSSARFEPGDDERSVYAVKPLTSQTTATTTVYEYEFRGKNYKSGKRQWATPKHGLDRLVKANRVEERASSIGFVRFFHDFSVVPETNIWTDTGTGSFTDAKVYVVQTGAKIVQRCILMATDPGDLVLDPTCGSGTTTYVAEQWGRRWITIDTSRVALALARARIMGARYPFYLLADSKEGQAKEAEVTRTPPKSHPTHGNIRQGFVYERVPHITLKSIANNAEIDVIWDKFQLLLEPLREQLNAAIKKSWQEWEIPREADETWSDAAKKLHADWWQQRIARQKEIDASIAAKADFEYLYDRPYEDKKKVRVAGPFTVESLLPHRVLGVDEDDNLIDPAVNDVGDGRLARDFVQIILDNLRSAGVQQADKSGKIDFTSLAVVPGDYVCAEGRYMEGSDADGNGGTERRAGVFIGPEFGTVSRPDLVAAAREAAERGFDVLIACAFNYDAHSSEFNKLGKVPVLKARMNADLHMAEDLKNTGKGNLFVIFGEPDIDILDAATGRKLAKGETPSGDIQVKVNGVDVFHPNTGEVRSDGAEGIACWFIDTDYNEESFFVRHAYFLGASDPYKSLKTTLKAEINAEAWESLNSDTSRPFGKPVSGRIAVKVINHLGDEVMKVFKI